MKITIKELELCFKRIIESLKNLHIEQPIVLDTNYYLTIPSHQWCNLNNLNYNKTPNVGSLDDDMASLKSNLSETDDFTFVDMDRIANILRAMSQEFNPPYPSQKALAFSKFDKKEIEKKIREGRKKELYDQLHKCKMALSQIEEAKKTLKDEKL